MVFKIVCPLWNEFNDFLPQYKMTLIVLIPGLVSVPSLESELSVAAV